MRTRQTFNTSLDIDLIGFLKGKALQKGCSPADLINKAIYAAYGSEITKYRHEQHRNSAA